MMITRLATLVLVGIFAAGVATGREPWSITSSAEWTQATASANNLGVEDALANGRSTPIPTLALKAAGEGQWTSQWHHWRGDVDSAEIRVEVAIDMFTKKTIETVVKGADVPYTNADGVPNDWYGRCMIAIIDENHWIMALRSGIDHVSWGKRDTIHLLTSTNEGRTWGKLDQWFDETPISGMPYEDGNTHSEPGLYKMPNGDLVLQFWKDRNLAGTKQLRSTDMGKTWLTDIDQIDVAGVPKKPGNLAIGTQNHFVDLEHPSDVYMAFEYYYNPPGFAGSMLAKSQDNGRSYQFVSWLSPTDLHTFEPAIEYVGNRTIVAVLRGSDDNHTWQTKSTDMGLTFSPPVDISAQINGGVPHAAWQRARLYKESNPIFQYNNRLNYEGGEGRLWGFGIHSVGGGYTRKPVVYWSDDDGASWYGPELLHGPMYPGTDTGYGDMKRRADGAFVAATYYANRNSTVADVEQYTFGVEEARAMIEADRDGDGTPDAISAWRQLYNGTNAFAMSDLKASRWRLRLSLSSSDPAVLPRICNVTIIPR